MFELLSKIYNTFLFIPILNALIVFYFWLGHNMGFAIIALTLVIKLMMFPLSQKQLETAKKQKELQPHLDKLKKKYKDKTVYTQKQMELFKEHGVNPASGCLTSFIPILIIFPLYRVFTYTLSAAGTTIADINNLLYFDFYRLDPNTVINTTFGYLDLSKPDPYYILPVLAAVAQFVMSKMMMPGIKKMEKDAKKTKGKSDDIMSNMQGQMAYIMPVMTLFIGIKLPSGLVLYWLISTLFAVGQYMMLNKENVVLFNKDKVLNKAMGVVGTTNSLKGDNIIEGEIIEDENVLEIEKPKKKKKKKKKKK